MENNYNNKNSFKEINIKDLEIEKNKIINKINNNNEIIKRNNRINKIWIIATIMTLISFEGVFSSLLINNVIQSIYALLIPVSICSIMAPTVLLPTIIYNKEFNKENIKHEIEIKEIEEQVNDIKKNYSKKQAINHQRQYKDIQIRAISGIKKMSSKKLIEDTTKEKGPKLKKVLIKK